jgi:hypothetical protein
MRQATLTAGYAGGQREVKVLECCLREGESVVRAQKALGGRIAEGGVQRADGRSAGRQGSDVDGGRVLADSRAQGDRLTFWQIEEALSRRPGANWSSGEGARGARGA